ncbi:22356_t:CDS:2 [Gigaspora margarita]|uniref:22356_t:CDS:1 n=1 Tax=Gigaspora margarita TaxID=4874 RepID=A0ABN7UGI8_GIGMA|nr:22356_t:CDS:2 [Gigaspora margarita]
MATLVNDRIYFFGGSRRIPMISPSWIQTHQFNLSGDVFYLDLSSQFNVDLPPLTDLSFTSRMPFGSEKGVTVLENVCQELTDYHFPGADPLQSLLIIYIFGGRVQIDTSSDVFILFDDFSTFDTLLLKWSNLSLPNHPSK